MNTNEYVNKLNVIESTYHSADMPDMFIEELAQEYTLQWLLPKLASKQRILELGYGDGVINKGIQGAGLQVNVIEGSPQVIQRAKQEFPGIDIEESLFENYQPKAAYDCVLAMHVLEHVDDPISLLSKMRDWVTPGGDIILIAPNMCSLHRQLAVEMGLQEQLDDLSARDLVVGHQRVYSHSTLRSDVEAAGAIVVEETGFFLKSLPNAMMLEYSQDLLRAMNSISTKLPPELLANIGMVIRFA
ncbi:MAG: 2-polyprenyl-3-methyl-5-hydroxy-6-metoxy-1,4-benzoquinol methylase [Candidatus Azotimanducaceae bacterium]|jgi:2-polyprenyl-3-methyl-5-hydroxy-6-metoxy-1,4-benzoquinol methylase